MRAVQNSLADHRRRYASLLLTPQLQKQAYSVGRHQLRKLIHQAGLVAIEPRRFVPGTTDSRYHRPFSANLWRGAPLLTAPGQVQVRAITYRPLANGEWACLDLYSRLIAGWQVEFHREESLVDDALKKAFLRRH